jgi:hypothetical protein
MPGPDGPRDRAGHQHPNEGNGNYPASLGRQSRSPDDNGILNMATGLTDRRAIVTTALGYADADGVQVFTGTVNGTLATGPRGTSGFGYDAIFIPDTDSGHRTYAQDAPVFPGEDQGGEVADHDLRGAGAQPGPVGGAAGDWRASMRDSSSASAAADHHLPGSLSGAADATRTALPGQVPASQQQGTRHPRPGACSEHWDFVV